jgi:LysR family nitrogen assimilation transcriptional regulator
MDFRQLRYFVAVATHGSMAAAGRAIHVSQPALGEKIRQLEDELGVPLLERHSRGVRLSAAGERFLEHAGRILGQIDAARRDIARFAQTQPLRLSLGLNPTASRWRAVDLLGAFGPSAQVLLREGMSNEVQTDVAAGRLDAGFCYDPPAGPYHVREVGKEPLYLVGPARLVQSSTDLPFRELERYSLVLDSGFNVLRSSLEETARRHRIRLKVAYEVEPVVLKRRLLLRHDQCTVVPHALFADEIAGGILKARRIVEPRLRRRLCLIYRQDLAPALVHLLRTRLLPLALAATGHAPRSLPDRPARGSSRRQRHPGRA